jgi:hypothetical protein
MTNALFNDNRLKLGVFGLNVSNGCAATTAEGHLQPTWHNNVTIASMADRAGIEALVPVARWKGFGGQTNFNGTCMVDRLLHLSAMGLDGVVLSWVNYEAELAYWISDVLPLMEQAGLRRPYAPAHAR